MKKTLTLNQKILFSKIPYSKEMNAKPERRASNSRWVARPVSQEQGGRLGRAVLSGALLLTLWVSGCSPEDKTKPESGNWPAYYAEAGTITISDPLASLVGSLPYGKAHIEISLADVAKYTGHVCPGVYSGFVMTRKALQKLYPDSVPQRGQVKITGNFGHDLLDVAAYITGARANYGRGEINQGDLTLDKSLGKDHANKVIIFGRKDTEQRVQAVFHSNALLSPSKRATMKKKMMKVLTGKASAKEKMELAQKVQAKIKLLVKEDNVQKVISVKKI